MSTLYSHAKLVPTIWDYHTALNIPLTITPFPKFNMIKATIKKKSPVTKNSVKHEKQKKEKDLQG